MSLKVVLRWIAGAIAVCFVAAAAVLVPSRVTPALAPGGDELVVPPVVAQAEVQARVAAEATPAGARTSTRTPRRREP
ncbi:MAG: hypothetical protein M3168_02300 [Actinomycetota bacterium]|nr:hypothetical protein [Actinomycetota bacterium]